MSKIENNRPRKIMVAVAGLSPQIITETLYALAVKRKTAWIPDEIHVITTAEGGERVRLSLLSDGWFAKLLKDYELPDIQFGPEQIHIIKSDDGAPLDDIRTDQDNEQTANLITDKIRMFCEMDTELHVSIAGGRKTMGYYLGYAMSLFGRPQDRLSHVLVSQPFESSWDFFYPTRYSNIIYIKNGNETKPADTKDAEVILAEIPFISIRRELPTRLLKGSESFSQTVNAAKKALEPPELVIDLPAKRLSASGEIVSLAPVELAFYSLCARFAATDQGDLNRTMLLPDGISPEADHDDLGITERFLDEYRQIVGEYSGNYEQVETAVEKGMTTKYFDERKAKTNRALKQALGEQLAKPYLISSRGHKSGLFGLNLDSDAISHIGN